MVSVEDRRPENDLVRDDDDLAAFDDENELSNAPRTASQSGSTARTGSFDEQLAGGLSNVLQLNLTEQERDGVRKMIHYERTTEKPTKAGRIWAGFNCKKGESKRYERASEIHDALFGAPGPAVKFTNTPEQAAFRKRIGLDV